MILVLALSVAMAGVGFAHRGPERGLDPDYIAYLAAGGSADDLCDHDADEGGTDHAKTGNGCEACRLVDSVVLPQQVRAAERWTAPRDARVRPAPAGRPVRLTTGLLPQGRAPPRA